MTKTSTSTSRQAGVASKVTTRKGYAKPDFKRGPVLVKVTASEKGSPRMEP